MTTIHVDPTIIDKAMIVMVQPEREIIGVWKGRSRVDLYDFSGEWHEMSRAFARQEEGLWSRDDMLVKVASLVASADPNVRGLHAASEIAVSVESLCSSSLIRANRFGSVAWDGVNKLTGFAADGTEVCSARVEVGDLPSISQLLRDLLALLPRLAGVVMATDVR